MGWMPSGIFSCEKFHSGWMVISPILLWFIGLIAIWRMTWAISSAERSAWLSNILMVLFQVLPIHRIWIEDFKKSLKRFFPNYRNRWMIWPLIRLWLRFGRSLTLAINISMKQPRGPWPSQKKIGRGLGRRFITRWNRFDSAPC